MNLPKPTQRESEQMYDCNTSHMILVSHYSPLCHMVSIQKFLESWYTLNEKLKGIICS